MPYAPIADNTALTAAHMLSNFYNQVIAQVTSSTRPGSPAEGQVIYETDTDLLYIYNGGWINFGASGTWISYTPTITQSGAVTKTVSYARYMKVGRTVTVNIRLDLTGSGTANNAITVSTPVTAAYGNYLAAGSGYIYDASATTTFPALVVLNSTTVFAFVDGTVGLNVNTLLGITGAAFAAALASGDAIGLMAVFEAAA